MKTVLVGLDAFDPRLFEKFAAAGQLPNLQRMAELGGYTRFEVADPPQSEVSWTSIASGLDPGGHGLFDFVQRDPANYRLYVSLLPTRKGLLGVEFDRPFSCETLFDLAARQGYPATALWWPGLFPANPGSPVAALPGLGTPDIQGKLGVGALYSTAAIPPRRVGKTPVSHLEKEPNGVWTGAVQGPRHQGRKGVRQLSLPFELRQTDAGRTALRIQEQEHNLETGVWSPIIELKFPLGFLTDVRAITRFLLIQTEPELRLYRLPVQLHPLKPLWQYASPAGLAKAVWRTAGPYLTIGWPQDTTGLEDGCMSDAAFLDLCSQIFAQRERAFLGQVARFREGVLGGVFDSLDRIQHMFLAQDESLILDWYRKYDALVGKVAAALAARHGEAARLIVVSDHGFGPFTTKVHLNRWLEEHGYLARRDPHGAPEYANIDWARTRAYGIGLNSLYLNLAGREGKGIVPPAAAGALKSELVRGLAGWRDAQGQAVVQAAQRGEEIFNGPYIDRAPDILVGYTPGRRGSQKNGLGDWAADSLEPNRDHWQSDHCFAAKAVPGVLFSSLPLDPGKTYSYRDIPRLATGLEPQAPSRPPPRRGQSEDQAALEERLKSLGYL